MDYGYIKIVIIIIAAIGGFVVLDQTLMANWREDRRRRKAEAMAHDTVEHSKK